LTLVDTSGLLAALDRAHPDHHAAARLLANSSGPLLLSPFVLAELEYLLSMRVGTTAALAFLAEVSRGAYRLEPFAMSDVTLARGIIERYRRLDIGLADASIVVLAGRHGVRDVLTLDRRHFSALRTPSGQRFRMLPP